MGNMLRVATLHTTVVLALLVSFSLCTTLSREKPPHPDYRTGVPGYTAPSFDGYGLEGCAECSQITLFCFVVVAVLRYRDTKPDGWLNYRARRRLRGRARMWNEAVDRLVPLSLVSIAVRRVARELEQNAKYESERLSRRYSNDGLIYVWWGKIKQYKAYGLCSVAIIMKFPLKLLTHPPG